MTPNIRQLLLIVFSLCVGQNSFAQGKYWVSFTDKAGVSFDPYSYFDAHAIQQKLDHNIPLCDLSDFAVSEEYLSAVSALVDSVSWESRWLNGVAVYASRSEILVVKNLQFVSDIEEMSVNTCAASRSSKSVDELNNLDKALLSYQLMRMQGDAFIKNHYDGKGIRIAVFDAGFPGVDKHPAFSGLREGKQIIDTYDFVCHSKNVYKSHWHGSATLSCIAGKSDTINIGLATGAEFLLARTENTFSERLSEEENWLAAAEWADKHGVNIISSSLGYAFQRYFNFEMNGRKSLIARSASVAASKGILIVNAAGNEGTNSWHYIVTPADADSVLTVGGTDPTTDAHIYFSSYGPTGDGRLKPNVCAVGEAITTRATGFARSTGTSFSTPLVAGFAACAWQAHRQWSNMELFDAIEKSSSLYPYFDYAHGFGIPQAGWFVSEKSIQEPTFDFVIINNEVKVILREQFSYTDSEAALGFPVRRNMYYKVEDKDGIVKKYSVILADRKEMMHVYTEDFHAGDVMTIHFEGYTSSYNFPEEIK